MAKTRTMVEINKDYKICKKYVDEHPTITSLKEVADAVGLTESQVKTSLSRHPRVFNGIKNQIAGNLEAVKAQVQAQKVAEKEAKRKAEQEALEAEKNATNASEIKKSKFVGFVIDASITGIDGIMDTLDKICATKSKIILTSVTIKELEKMQRFRDTDGNDARRILAKAAGDYDHFECVLIDETVGCADDCTIKYCTENRDDVVLLTSDKTMELKARTYGIKTHFFKQNKNAPVTTRPAFGVRTHTLYATRKIDSKLVISDFGNDYKSVRVISGGIEYDAGIVELKIGDDIYIATKKDNYMTFAHYKMISLAAENNCNLVYSKRLYDLTGINDLPEAGYKSFMRDFKRKVDF